MHPRFVSTNAILSPADGGKSPDEESEKNERVAERVAQIEDGGDTEAGDVRCAAPSRMRASRVSSDRACGCRKLSAFPNNVEPSDWKYDQSDRCLSATCRTHSRRYEGGAAPEDGNIGVETSETESSAGAPPPAPSAQTPAR